MPAWVSASAHSAAMAMLGARVSRIIGISDWRPSALCAGFFECAIGVAAKAPGRGFLGDAAPGAAFFSGSHLGPVLNFIKRAAAALAQRIPLAGGAYRDARRVSRGVVPGAPGRHGLGRKALLVGLVLVIE